MILISGGRILWDAGKSTLGFFGLINITTTQVDVVQLNKDAKASFTTLIDNIEKCRKSQDTNCLCYTSLSGFNEIHNIEISNDEIKLINIKDENKITMDKRKLENFNCYYKDTNFELESPLLISFDDSLPEINKGFLSSDVKFYRNTPIYKSNKMCLVSIDSSLIKTGKICKI